MDFWRLSSDRLSSAPSTAQRRSIDLVLHGIGEEVCLNAALFRPLIRACNRIRNV